MKKLPVLSGRDVVRALERAGFVTVRISGSHHRMQHRDDPARATTVPVHANRDLPRGTLRDIIDQTGLTVEEFVDLL
jgi:predicted RNA binding protein YcfA (HicA-like mRNA interferase family)